MPKPRPLLAATTLALALFCSATPLSLANTSPLATAPAHAGAPARVIVKFKSDAAAQRSRVLTASAQGHAQAVQLGRRHGLALSGGFAIAERLHVVRGTGLSAQALAAKLSQDSEVEYAVPDGIRHVHSAPNDPRYADGLGGSGPAAGQWYLRAPAGPVQAGIDVEAAWAVTPGDPNVVVAVLDTGVRYDHADLPPVSSGGNLLPGFDMINDALVANDGDGRDADASDPGDGLTAADVAAGGAFAECETGEQFSSWHGTQTSALIAALSNNGIGMAGVGGAVRVLPMRVLGKCGGRDSDIIAAMRWAAGLAVDGVSAVNPTPARVINLSLGGEGACSQAYLDAIGDVTRAGALVVVSAGNTVGHAVTSPANCPGVVAVAGLQHTGAKVGFSDIGPEVTISAPAGNCVDDPDRGCRYPILTATNAGEYAPEVGSSAYTDSQNYSVGTSFAAPLVSGTAALMLSVRPDLTPQQLKLLLQASARPFPTAGAVVASGGVPASECTSAQYDPTGSPVAQLQCYCSTGTCGAGMLDAGAAVRAAAQPSPDFKVQARVDLTPLQPSAGVPLQLSALNSAVDSSRGIVSYRWSLLDGGGIVDSITNPDGRDASVKPTGAGQFAVTLTVQDDGGATSMVALRVAVASGAPPVVLPPSDDGGGGGAVGGGWLLGLLAGCLALAASRAPRRC